MLSSALAAFVVPLSDAESELIAQDKAALADLLSHEKRFRTRESVLCCAKVLLSCTSACYFSAKDCLRLVRHNARFFIRVRLRLGVTDISFFRASTALSTRSSRTRSGGASRRRRQRQQLRARHPSATTATTSARQSSGEAAQSSALTVRVPFLRAGLCLLCSPLCVFCTSAPCVSHTFTI